MSEVKITYETLFDLLRREKDREELQELDENFYEDVMSYLQQKHSLLEGKGSQSELFGASESEKVKIQIQNIKKIVKDLYERRESKILRLAVNTSKTGSEIVDTTAMLPEEKKFFKEALSVLNQNRKDVLARVLLFDSYRGDKIVGSPKPVSQMQEKPKNLESDAKEKEPGSTTEKEATQEQTNTDEDKQASKESDVAENAEKDSSSQEKSENKQAPDKDYEKKVKVKFTGSVPKFVGKQLEVYGPYEEGDAAEVPRIIANILLKKKRVEIIDS